MIFISVDLPVLFLTRPRHGSHQEPRSGRCGHWRAPPDRTWKILSARGGTGDQDRFQATAFGATPRMALQHLVCMMRAIWYPNMHTQLFGAAIPMACRAYFPRGDGPLHASDHPAPTREWRQIMQKSSLDEKRATQPMRFRREAGRLVAAGGLVAAQHGGQGRRLAGAIGDQRASFDETEMALHQGLDPRRIPLPQGIDDGGMLVDGAFGGMGRL